MSKVRVRRTQGVTHVELFFDLVFVFAVTQLTSFLHRDLTWSGVGRTAVLFWMVWWSWTQFTWALNKADTEHAWVRLATLVATAVAFFLAQAIPDAYGSAAPWFAGSYVVARAIGLYVQLMVFRDDRKQMLPLRRWSAASVPGLAFALIGATIGSDARLSWWVAAIVADLLAAGIAGQGVWRLAAGHFAERHGLIVIIALGESLIAAGVASDEVARDATFAVVAVGAVAAACALWWTYFGVVHGALEHAMDSQADEDRGGFARDVFSISHALVVAGVIGIAIGFEEAIAHPAESFHDEVAMAFVVGIALFIGGVAISLARAGIRATVGLRGVVVLAAIASLVVLDEVSAGTGVWGLAALATTLAVVETRALANLEEPDPVLLEDG